MNIQATVLYVSIALGLGLALEFKYLGYIHFLLVALCLYVAIFSRFYMVYAVACVILATFIFLKSHSFSLGIADIDILALGSPPLIYVIVNRLAYGDFLIRYISRKIDVYILIAIFFFLTSVVLTYFRVALVSEVFADIAYFSLCFYWLCSALDSTRRK